MHIIRRIIVASFILVMWAPLLAVLASPRFPEFVRNIRAAPGNFEGEQAALRRMTPLWDVAVAGYNRALHALGSTSNRSIAVAGRDGWLFLGDRFHSSFSQAIGRAHIDDAHIGRWASFLREHDTWLTERGIGHAFVVAPAKWSIHPGKLPAWAPRPGMHPFDRLLATRAIAQMPDLREALREASRTTATFSPFNSHWTNYGAWIAWRELAGSLRTARIDWGTLPVPSPRAVPLEVGFNEFAGMLGLTLDNPWTGFVPDPPYPPYLIENADGSLVEMPGATQTNLLDLPRTTRNPHAPNPRTILMLRDSTADSPSLFFQATFARTIQIDHALNHPGAHPDLRALVERHHPDLVIWFVAERYLIAEPFMTAAVESTAMPTGAPSKAGPRDGATTRGR